MKIQFVTILAVVAAVGCRSIPTHETAPVSATFTHSHLRGIGATRTARGVRYAIASGGKFSSEAGGEVFEKGGNIVDALVAVSFCLAVERPHSLGLGGGGLMTLHLAQSAKKNYFIDFRESAPKQATPTMYLDPHGEPIAKLSQIGSVSVAVPGFVAGLYDAHKRWGVLPWKTVLAPSIRRARAGFVTYPTLAEKIASEFEIIQKDRYAASILAPNGAPIKSGERLVQKDLAQTIELIAKRGKRAFYHGSLSRAITETIRRRGGIWSQDDLAKYRVIDREPLRGRLFDFEIVTAPPPSAGGALFVQWANVLEGFEREWLLSDGPRYFHILAEAMKRGYADRSRFFGDPDYSKQPWENTVTKEYASRIRQSLSLEKATPSSAIISGIELKETSGTTHLSIMDDLGNAAGVTLSINDVFGSRIAVPGTGIFLNNTMDDFSVKPGVPNVYGLVGNDVNAIAPNKRPVSSTMPTILLKNGSPILVVGGAGGSRITSSVSQVVFNYLFVFPNDLVKSQEAARLHHQWLPDQLELESGGFDPSTRSALATKGHLLVSPPYLAKVQAVARDATTRVLWAVADPRDDGAGVSAR